MTRRQRGGVRRAMLAVRRPGRESGLRLAWLLVLVLAAGCGTATTQQQGQEAEVDDTEATQRAEAVVDGVLEAVAPGREPTPSPGSGELGPPCDPDGPVTRSRFVGASVPLDADDDPASVVEAAASWFVDEGLEVVEKRIEPPQRGVHARDADGGTYSLRVLDGGGQIAAGANTPCLPESSLAPAAPQESDGADAGSAADEDLHDLLAEVADAVGEGAASGTVPTDCPRGVAVQRSLDLGDEDAAAAAYARLVEHLGGLGRPVEGTNPDGTRFVTVERGDTVVGGVHVAGSASVILSAERGCEEE